jgi:hypothetical protein
METMDAGSPTKTRNRPGAGTVAACCAAAVLAGVCGARAEPLGVVELFTSQGCSSCPPAESALGRLAADGDVIALTFSVDYWDYVGWKDTFAKPEFTKRQRGYAAARGEHGVYTPQAVVNGRDDVIGSDEPAIRAMLASLKKKGAGLSVNVKAAVRGDRVVVVVPAGTVPGGRAASLWIAAFRPKETVAISQGENEGRRITYHNVVERWQVLGMWDGKPLTVEVPLGDIAQDKTGGLAVILQTKVDGKPGPILGAAKVDLVAN